MEPPHLTLFVSHGETSPPVVPSARWRTFLPRAAAFCTPLIVGNQLGWTVLAPERITAVWHGADHHESVQADPPHRARGHFGHGILTMHLPFRIHTNPGIWCWVKAVPNYPLDGICPLEGLTETDWLDGTFTVNFRFTRPYVRVTWEAGTPLVQLVPYPRDWIKQTTLEVVREGADYEAAEAAHQQWRQDRAALLRYHADHPEMLGKVRDGAYRAGRRHDDGPTPGPPQHRLHLATIPGVDPLEAF